MLYLCTHEVGSTPFVVVLGFFSGQKEDIVTKDLIEPIAQENRRQIGEIVQKLVSAEYSDAHIFFL